MAVQAAEFALIFTSVVIAEGVIPEALVNEQDMQ